MAYRHIVLEPETGKTRLIVNLPSDNKVSVTNTMEKVMFLGLAYGVFLTGIWMYMIQPGLAR